VDQSSSAGVQFAFEADIELINIGGVNFLQSVVAQRW
jgi:hypothetical protein